MNNNDMTIRSSLLVVFICTLFGGNAVAIKYCLMGFGAFTSAGIRFSIAALVIISWAGFRKIPLKLTRMQMGQTFVLGAIFVVQLSCFYHGLEQTSASHGVLIANALPFFISILAHFFIPGDSITLKKAVGMAVGFTGVVFLFLDQPVQSHDFKTGDLLVLCAVVLWSISAVRVKQIIAGYNAVQITLFPMLFAVPFFFAAGVIWDDPMILKVTAPVVFAMFYQSFVTASFGFIIWNTLLLRYGVTALHSFIFIVPLAGVVAGVTLLNDVVTAYLFVSVLFIAAGVAVVNFKGKTNGKCLS